MELDAFIGFLLTFGIVLFMIFVIGGLVISIFEMKNECEDNNGYAIFDECIIDGKKYSMVLDEKENLFGLRHEYQIVPYATEVLNGN